MNTTEIVKRDDPEPHYERHYPDHVEFWTLDGRKLGESEIIETVE